LQTGRAFVNTSGVDADAITVLGRIRKIRDTGVVFVAALAGLATVLGGVVPVVGAPVIAILCGIAISLVKTPSTRLKPGIAFSSKKVLQGAIVLFGSGLSLGQVLATGGRSLPVLMGTLVAALTMAWLAGRLLGLRGDVDVGFIEGSRPRGVCGRGKFSPTAW
jgi:uncharacterized membrane protein YadS